MHRSVRRLLPVLVAALWLIATASAGAGRFSLSPAAAIGLLDGWAEWELLGWFGAMLTLMLVADRLWCRLTLWRAGPFDPARVDWRRLRNRDGNFNCAACGSINMLPPPGGEDRAWVRCGDCGTAKARWGEMKPYLLGARPDALKILWRRHIWR